MGLIDLCRIVTRAVGFQWRSRELLVKSFAALTRANYSIGVGRHLFKRGPMTADGQLDFVIS